MGNLITALNSVPGVPLGEEHHVLKVDVAEVLLPAVHKVVEVLDEDLLGQLQVVDQEDFAAVEAVVANHLLVSVPG